NRAPPRDIRQMLRPKVKIHEHRKPSHPMLPLKGRNHLDKHIHPAPQRRDKRPLLRPKLAIDPPAGHPPLRPQPIPPHPAIPASPKRTRSRIHQILPYLLLLLSLIPHAISFLISIVILPLTDSDRHLSYS